MEKVIFEENHCAFFGKLRTDNTERCRMITEGKEMRHQPMKTCACC